MHARLRADAVGDGGAYYFNANQFRADMGGNVLIETVSVVR